MIDYSGEELSFSKESLRAANAGFTRDQSRACMLADTLTWAVTHHIPLPAALLSLPFYRNIPRFNRRWDGIVRWLRDTFLPFRPFFWIMNLRWSYHLRSMIADLENGEPLSSALERNFGRHFPGFFFLALAQAERDRRLETAIPLLADQLRFPATVRTDRTNELAFGGIKVIFALQVFIFVMITLVPKFEVIFADLTEMNMDPSIFTSIRDASVIIVPGIFILAGVLFMLCYTEGIGEFIILRLPVLGHDRRCFLLSDLARGMAAFLRQGADIVTAAEWSLSATRSHWVQRHLQKFIEDVRGGRNWLEAWSNMGLQRPIDNWVIANANARRDPAAGFDLMAQWLHQEIQLTTRRMERWIDPICTFLTAAIILYAAWLTFSLLTGILWSLM